MSMEESAISEMEKLHRIIERIMENNQTLQCQHDEVVSEYNEVVRDNDNLLEENARLQKMMYMNGFHEYGFAEKGRKLN